MARLAPRVALWIGVATTAVLAELAGHLEKNEVPSFWLCIAFAALAGVSIAVNDDGAKLSGGTGPISHIDECLDSAHALLADSLYLSGGMGRGIGSLEPLRELFASRPYGLTGLGGLLAFISSLLTSVTGLASKAWSKFASLLCARKSGKVAVAEDDKIKMSFQVELKCYSGYIYLLLMGIVREYTVRFLALILGTPRFKAYVNRERWIAGWADFYINHCKTYIEEVLARPITSAPDATFDVQKRSRPGGVLFEPLYKLEWTGEVQKCINLSSYNYLGFGGIDTFCTPAARECAITTGFSAAGARTEGGTLPVHRELEEEVAAFLGKEDALVLGMGFASNSTILPALFEAGGKGILVLSDELNHRSIVEGVRLSGATVKAFAHNSMIELEEKLDHAVQKGQPDGTPWRKIFIVVEGIYSMEGDFCRLREIVTLKNRYKAYLYLDEAHSIGAVGPSGRGVTDLLGVPTSEVEVMMGTFTKSFGSAGGYVAASRDVINALRQTAPGSVFAAAMAPPCAAQALAAFRVIAGKEAGDVGAKKLHAIKENSNWFRMMLEEKGFKTLGDEDSPIIPMMIHHPLKMKWFSQMCMQRGVAVVVVGYPAVPLQYERCRFCISAAHTREQLQKALAVVVEVGDQLGIRFEKDMDPNVLAERKERMSKYAKQLRDAPLVLRGDDAGKYKAWNPEPLVPATPAAAKGSALAAVIEVEQRTTRDFRLFDPVGYAKQSPDSVRRAIESTMDTYGFGACGPRGFYGTTIPHLELESAIAKFLRMEAAILYSAGAVTISSVIPALVQPGDRVILDTEVQLGIKAGLRLCKADIKWIPHNDLPAMERALQELASPTPGRKRPADERKRRTFLIVEAICQRTGKLAPLSQIIALKQKYKALLMLDETLSFGTLGANGRGLCEHFQLEEARHHVDAIVGSLEHACANVGGFCAGRQGLVEHQRLGGAGYCFSAASPPCSASAAQAVIEDLAADTGAKRLERLRANAKKLHDTLREAVSSHSLKLTSDPDSYVQHLIYAGEKESPGQLSSAALQKIAARCKETNGVTAQVCDPTSCSAETAFEKRIGAPEAGAVSLRFCASSYQSDEDIAAVATALREALSSLPSA
jgi:7-keto-8-aminopelargonate synthetase-like enzyme